MSNMTTPSVARSRPLLKWALQLLTGCVVYGLLFVVIMLVVAFVPLPAGVARGSLLAGTATLWVGSTLVLGVTLVAVITARRHRRLDAAFAPLGLQRQGYLENGRQYHGEYRQRRVDAYIDQKGEFTIYLSTSLQTQATFNAFDPVGPNAANGAGTSRPVTYTAVDEPWVLRLLADPAGLANMQQLLRDPTAGTAWWPLCSLELVPEAWLLSLRGYKQENVTAADNQARLNDLHSLATVAEGLPAPQVAQKASTFDRSMRTARDSVFPIMAPLAKLQYTTQMVSALGLGLLLCGLGAWLLLRG